MTKNEEVAREIVERLGRDWIRYPSPYNVETVMAILERVYGQEEQGWQPIESAPRDQTRILLWWPYWNPRPFVGYRSCNAGTADYNDWVADCILSIDDDKNGPIAWMSLPEPPARAVVEE